MAREILFRGKSKDSGEWVYGSLLKDLYDTNIVVWFDEGRTEIWTEVDKNTVGQYTGLKDKNGEKIFEGDILVSGQWTALMLWNEELATFALRFPFEDTVDSTPLGGWQTMAIMSNIYDNPELFECEERRWKKSKCPSCLHYGGSEGDCFWCNKGNCVNFDKYKLRQHG